MELGGQELALHRRLKLDSEHPVPGSTQLFSWDPVPSLDSSVPTQTHIYTGAHTNRKEFTNAKMVN